MKNTKRLLCLLLCTVMVLSLLAACGGQGEETQPTASTSEAETSVPTTVPETTVPETTAAPTEPPVTHLTVGELETLLNEKFAEIAFPLTLEFERNERDYGSFSAHFSYTGEYADLETNKLIREFEGIFSIYLDATGIFNDSLVRKIYWIYNKYMPDKLKDAEPEFVESLPDLTAEIASLIAHAMYNQAPEDIGKQLSKLDPTEEFEDGYTHYALPGIRFDNLVCLIHDYDGYLEFIFSDRELIVPEFNPHIPHGSEVNEPQYLGHEFLFGEEMMGDDNIPYIYPSAPSVYGDIWEYALATYSPIRTEPYKTYSDNGRIVEKYCFYYDSSENSIEGGLDLAHYGIVAYFDESYTHNEIYTYYNTNYKEHFPQEYLSAGLDPEYALRVPIGISLIFDGEMTPEELSQFHTGKMEPTDTWRDYQVTVYCPRDVMHIMLSNPETGGHQFWLLDKARFDELYGDLTVFLDEKAESKLYVDP